MNPYDHYKRMQVETASQGRLIIMLYDGALKNLHTAQASIAAKNIEQAHRSLIKAQNIVSELNNTLNMEAGGEVAQNLRKLYQFVNRRLVQANVSKDTALIQDAIDVLSTLKEGWDAIILKKPVATTS
ncbi:flagellar protein flis [Lucifera butyrica]|uniref:Flagellar secretion chaperone FliS n=1 Tax=Lucifera butyrica TaxID=1351585 RepID=A0A498R3X4_9FIRM|nr:flagellar export chaperone FliS [Lucifera butyrica]VBB05547.1 flagellar protein flis [Lucifera butyrica]